MLNYIKPSILRLYCFLYNFVSAIYRDIIGIYHVVNVESKIRKIIKREEVLSDFFLKLVRKHPNKPCIKFKEETWTYQDIEEYSNQIANIFVNKFKLKKGDCVALLLENKPEYIATWIGLSKIGVISALINTNLMNQPLLHSIKIAQPKAVIYSSSLQESINTVADELDDIQVIADDFEKGSMKPSKAFNLKDLLAKTSKIMTFPIVKCIPSDPIMYVYTSGTTGLPKPAVIRQSRYCTGALTFYQISNLNPSDIVYITLPIYHANGALIGVGNALVNGATVVLRNKFSASSFWKDCIKYKCTAFIYVGEICRFLVNQPPSDLDRRHSIRKAIGNGLRENVWKVFYDRFNINCIEFYAASEGNCTMINITSKIGACGFVPLVNKFFKFLSVYLIKVDNEMNPIRDRNGHCIECKTGEKGLLIGMIGNTAKTAYNGYANNKKASNSKIIENVFKDGQRAFNSGDSMFCDSFGYMYFCDRLGDTYRWRGENVATTEVENAISGYLNSAEVSVYGVEIPGEEGRAGMAAVIVKDFDIDKLSDHLKKNLPAYARPLFLRICKEFDYTGSFKTIKKRFVDEAYDIEKTSDKMFFYDSKDQKFKPLTKKVLNDIKNGNIRI